MTILSPSDPFSTEDKIRTLDSLPDMICTLDSELKVRWVNAAMAKRLGVTPAEAIGLPCYEVVHDTASPLAFCPHCHILEDHQEHIGEVHDDRLGGDFLVTCTPMRDKDRQLSGSVMVVRDITERKAADRRAADIIERQARELAALKAFSRSVNANLSLEHTAATALEGLLQNVRTDIAFLFLREGDRLVPLKVVPEAGRELLGAIPKHRVGECMCGLAVRERIPLFSPNILEDRRCTWDECKKAGIRSLATLPLYGEDDEVIGVIGLASETERDFEQQASFLVTLAAQVSIALVNARFHETLKRELIERRQAEQALRESEERFHSLFVAMQEGFALHEVICDSAGKPIDYRYLDVNPGFERATGIPRERWIGHTVREVLPNIEDYWIESYGAVALSGQPATFENYVRELDQHYQVVAYSPKHGQFAVIALNVTQQKRAEEARQGSQALFSAFMDQIPGLVLIKDHELRPVYVNRTFRERLPADEWMGRLPEECFPAETAADMRARDEAALASGFERYEEIWPSLDGTLSSYETRKFRIEHPGGLPLLGALIIDISERKRIEQALEQEHNLYKDLVASQPSGVYRLRVKAQKPWRESEWVDKVESHYKYEMVSNRFCEILGVTREQCEMNASIVVETIHPEDRSDFVTRNVQALESLETFKWEGRLKVRDEVAWVYFASVPRCLDDGSAIWTGILLDITEFKQAEQQLQRQTFLFENLFKNSPEAIAVLDHEDRVLEINHSFETLFGYCRSEARGQEINDLVAPEPYRGDALSVSEMVIGGQVVEKEAIRCTKDGRPVDVTLIGYPLVMDRQKIGAYAIYRDNSERKRAEEEKEKLQAQLIQAQKMESVGRLAGGVAHDFNNMLGVILGNAELALNRIEPDNPLSTDLKEIQKAAERSADLTRQLLAFARKQLVAPKVLDLNETVENSLRMLRRLIGEDINLVWLPGNSLAPIFIDSSQVDQILANLCVNARDAIAGNGKITIETANVILEREHCAHRAGFVPGKYVLLAVSDNGSGMDAEMLSQIFEPFFTTKEIGKGTGLGLAMVYGAVRQNNGFIYVYSEPGQGTTFKIYLPQHTAKVVSRPEPGQATVPITGGETILLVEDEPAMLKMTAHMLETMGYFVIAAETPDKAIRLAQEHQGQIDLLVTDVVMPEMNGRDLARNIMSIYPGIKRLFMSGYTANVIADHGVLEKGVLFIQKPFAMQELGAKLDEALKDS